MTREAWGRWGSEDERGALNSIGPDEVTRATSLVRVGRVFSLAQPIFARMPVAPHRSRVVHMMQRDGGDYAAGEKRPGGFQYAEDALVTPVHLGTHIDALSHVWYEDLLYNGFSSHNVRSTVGASRCGVENISPIVTRAVLLDIAGLRGAPLPKGAVVSLDDLMRCISAAKIDVRPGDAVLLRTGWFETWSHDAAEYFSGEPGVDLDSALWLARQDISLLGADNYAVEAIPFASGTVFPVHQRLIRDFGIPLLEGLRLEELADAKVTECLLVAAPLPIVGGTGSPICPIAVI